MCLKHNINIKGGNLMSTGNSLEKFESTNLSRDNLSTETGLRRRGAERAAPLIHLIIIITIIIIIIIINNNTNKH